MPIEAGKLRERVEIQHASRSSDAVGSKRTTWTKLTDVWAEIRPLSGSNAEVNGARRTVETYKVTIRYREIDATDYRLVWKGKTLKITSAFPNQHEGFVLMEVETGSGSGG